MDLQDHRARKFGHSFMRRPKRFLLRLRLAVDSGGPILVAVGNEWYVAGIVAWRRVWIQGPELHLGRYGETSYGVKPGHYVDWIETTFSTISPVECHGEHPRLHTAELHPAIQAINRRMSGQPAGAPYLHLWYTLKTRGLPGHKVPDCRWQVSIGRPCKRQASKPPASGRTRAKPSCLSWLAMRAAEASFGQSQ